MTFITAKFFQTYFSPQEVCGHFPLWGGHVHMWTSLQPQAVSSPSLPIHSEESCAVSPAAAVEPRSQQSWAWCCPLNEGNLMEDSLVRWAEPGATVGSCRVVQEPAWSSDSSKESPHCFRWSWRQRAHISTAIQITVKFPKFPQTLALHSFCIFRVSGASSSLFESLNTMQCWAVSWEWAVYQQKPHNYPRIWNMQFISE